MFYNIVDACLEPQLAVKYDEFLIFRIAIFPDHGRIVLVLVLVFQYF